MIVVENLTKSFGGRDLLSTVSFSVSSHEKVGVVGANGSGKTTLLKMIAGDEPASGGQINISEGEKLKQINEAEGRARQIELLAQATATGLREVALAVKEDGGEEAVSLRIAEQYVSAFEKLAKESTTLLLPSNLSDVGGTVAGLQKVLKKIDATTP